mmetsp:Transcript_36302/g.80631  ORF Transcript_36302/g.80631 Transcript_36302/m.80631 type:complete len:206 (+) Transcript_36302:694-1311(+)
MRANVGAIDPHRARRGLLDAGHDGHERGLAGTVVPEQAKALARRHAERDVVHSVHTLRRPGAAIDLVDLVDLDHVAHGALARLDPAGRVPVAPDSHALGDNIVILAVAVSDARGCSSGGTRRAVRPLEEENREHDALDDEVQDRHARRVPGKGCPAGEPGKIDDPRLARALQEDHKETAAHGVGRVHVEDVGEDLGDVGEPAEGV